MESDEWIELEWLEGRDARRPDLVRYLREKYPELEGYRDEDIRVDVVCARDGVDRKRVLKWREPSRRAAKRKPRWA